MIKRSLIIVGIGILTGAALGLCAETPSARTGEPASGSANKPRPFKTDKEKLSYAIGMSIELQIEKYSGAMDQASFHEGIQDLVEGKDPRLTLEEAVTIVKEWQEKAKKEEITFHGDQIKAFQELSDRNQREGEKFLAENKARPDVITLESGLQYKVLKAGDGPKPTPEDTVISRYRGRLLDGTEFDNSFKRKTPATLAMKDLIKGWAEALQLMPVGSHWQLFIPEKLAFGNRNPGGGIGPNSTLLLDVELLGIKQADGGGKKSTVLTQAK